MELVRWNTGKRTTVEEFQHDQVFRGLDGKWGWWSCGPFEDGEPERWHANYSTREQARKARRQLFGHGLEK